MENFTPEMIEKAKAVKSSEELLVLAKENGMEMTEEQAAAYYAQLHPASGEIADEELENVAGGGCHSGDGRLVVTIGYACSHWVCTCGNTDTEFVINGHNSYRACTGVGCGKKKCCANCQHMSYERGLWLCNHPSNHR